MNVFKSWFSSGGSWFVLAGLWLMVWLLALTNGNASSSIWMLTVAVLFFIIGIAQKRRNRP